MRHQILERLKAVELEHDVRILYACESGSRAWGFASPDSDYDVRFLYAHDPNWYLSFDVERQQDAIECPIVEGIDCSGWDLRKALYLFRRSNGALLEWIFSPIKYVEHGTVANQLRLLASRFVNSKALCYHYSHMARRNARGYLFKDKVRLKKYFYVLRPLLAIRYLDAGKGVPPVAFESLVNEAAPEEIRHSIAELLRLKRKSGELGLGEPIPEISRFIETELTKSRSSFGDRGRPVVTNEGLRDQLNVIFRSAVLVPQR